MLRGFLSKVFGVYSGIVIVAQVFAIWRIMSPR